MKVKKEQIHLHLRELYSTTNIAFKDLIIKSEGDDSVAEIKFTLTILSEQAVSPLYIEGLLFIFIGDIALGRITASAQDVASISSVVANTESNPTVRRSVDVDQLNTPLIIPFKFAGRGFREFPSSFSATIRIKLPALFKNEKQMFIESREVFETYAVRTSATRIIRSQEEPCIEKSFNIKALSQRTTMFSIIGQLFVYPENSPSLEVMENIPTRANLIDVMVNGIDYISVMNTKVFGKNEKYTGPTSSAGTRRVSLLQLFSNTIGFATSIVENMPSLRGTQNLRLLNV